MKKEKFFNFFLKTQLMKIISITETFETLYQKLLSNQCYSPIVA